jgi:hypothetical protein
MNTHLGAIWEKFTRVEDKAEGTNPGDSMMGTAGRQNEPSE